MLSVKPLLAFAASRPLAHAGAYLRILGGNCYYTTHNNWSHRPRSRFTGWHKKVTGDLCLP